MTQDYEWHSFQGTLTSDNRDYCGIAERPDATLHVVIDGATPGPRGGDLAKELARYLVDQFLELSAPCTRTQISTLMQDAHVELCRRFPADSASFFILVQINDDSIITAHAGDCRLGRILPDNSIEWVSKAHTLANAIDDLSDAALIDSPNRHYLTRSFRPRELPEIEHAEFLPHPDDTFLIATDGFWADLCFVDQVAFLERKFRPSEKEADDKSSLILGKEKPTEEPEKQNNIYIRFKTNK